MLGFLTRRNAEKAKEIIQAVIKRLSHRNVNVILYSLTLSNALVQNCSLSLRLEIASRPYQSVLLKIIANPKTHVIVKNRILDLIQAWAEAFRDENSLDYMGIISAGLCQAEIISRYFTLSDSD